MHQQFSLRSTSFVILLTLGLSGCDGTLGEPLGPSEPGRVGEPPSGGDGDGPGVDGPGPESPQGSGDFASGNFDDAECAGRELHPGRMPGLVRLTHRQYDFALRDLLGIESNALAEFVADQTFYGFNNSAEKLSVEERQVSRYMAAAERIAGLAAGDLSRFANTVPCVAQSPDATCRDRFIADFLKLMFRRPLEAAEVTRYRTLFDAAPEMYDDGGSDFQLGVRLVLEAALQSPSFLYRAEVRDTPIDGAVVALTDHEVAARLALTLWSSVPDPSLIQRADQGQLHTEEQIEAEARRMLDDPRAQRAFDDFHAQWLEFDKLRFTKDPITFPDYNAEAYQSSAQQEALAFARYIGLEAGGNIEDLFTSPETFIDANLASTYGVSAPQGSGFTRVDLNPDERAGLFTQVGFLAGHADALNGSPIHRGAYIQKRVLCTVFGPLPANVGTLPERTGDIVTTRDQVEAKTEPPQCNACHARINPAGFAFEGFDTLGRARTIDNGEPVDTAATLKLDGEDVSFDGAVEFAHAIAASDTAKRCYETQWFRYAYGRGEQDDDVCLLSQIDTVARDSGYSIKEMLVAFTLSRGFRFRAQEEL